MPANVRIIHGPAAGLRAAGGADGRRYRARAADPATLCTYADLMRVPLPTAEPDEGQGAGADIRMVYSTLDALRIAREEPERRWCSSPSASRPRRRRPRWPF